MTSWSPHKGGSSSSSSNDEYTDYSCSTSIERLARDVESLLRSWHIHNGCDHHISMAKKNAPSSPPAAVNGNNHGTSNNSQRSAAGGAARDNSSSSHPQQQQQQQQPPSTPSSSSSSLLLRSDVLQWTVSLTSAARILSFPVELQLCLWDGPPPPPAATATKEQDDKELPHSLRRTGQTTTIIMPPHGSLFENFSTLFGIGQHITLSPTTRQQQTILWHGDLQFLAQSILQRHGSDTTARWMLQQILSNWLQTALNCAVSNCHCCIPVFGLWGPYQPQVSIMTTSSKQQQTNQQRRINPKNGDLQVFPSWLQSLATAELPPLPRMTHAQFKDVQALQNDRFVPPVMTGMVLPTVRPSGTFWCSVLPQQQGNDPSNKNKNPKPLLTNWGSILLQHCPEDTVVLWCARHVFCWWKQPLQKATAFQLLFHPDNYHLENEHNPHTEWRRRRRKGKPKLSCSHQKSQKEQGEPHHPVIDLTGEYDDDDDNNDQQQPNYDDEANNSMQLYYKRLEEYQDECRALALALLEQAAGASSPSQPMWGPMDDPVASIHATVTWNGSPAPPSSITDTSNNNNHSNSSLTKEDDPDSFTTNEALPRQPLLSFPLRIRSRHSMSQEDWMEVEESVERNILDPRRPCQFHIQAWWDLETPVASLAATQRCVLAALIRTATLPDETLLKHITDDAVLEQWDNASGNVVAACLADEAKVGPTTKALVDAMDWDTAAEDKMELRDAEVLVRHILQPDNGSNFPQPPTSPLDDLLDPSNQGAQRRLNPLAEAAAAGNISSSLHGDQAGNSEGEQSDGSNRAPNMKTFAPLFKSAPIGRLVSILCVHMARLRSPCSMAMLWLSFCHEVRMRWEHRLRLPHMNHVSGLDPSSMEMKERSQCLTTLGVKAQNAAFWQGSLASSSASNGASAAGHRNTYFPGDHHCLLGQKLQVVNLCIELATLEENHRVEENDKQPPLSEPNNDSKPPSTKDSFGSARSEADHTMSSSTANDTSSHGSAEFADALSEEDLFTTEDDATAAAAKRSMAISQTSQAERRGARCPVVGTNLVATGEVLYAPFLQRPYPLTDDVISERRMMVARHLQLSSANDLGIQKRLEVSYRLQKPKLLSDMRAFKAANPGAIFQDFINWYGNPGNPLDDYSDTRSSSKGGATISDVLLGRASTESVAMKLDKAAEAIQMLNETREFWSQTWNEATPKPASEQRPLFDVSSTVEMAIDFLEIMHPAILVNQVLSVNLSVAFFTLMGAAKETGVIKVSGLVQRCFERLRQRIENALEMLSGDATRSTAASCNDARRHEGGSSFVSLRVISACDAACNALSEAEVSLSRATSLLHKFPEQYELVERILRSDPGDEIVLNDRTSQEQILSAIQKQQLQGQSQSKKSPAPDTSTAFQGRPALREYVFRNLDDAIPCQLCVRYGDEVAMKKNTKSANDRGKEKHHGGGVMIALTKTFAE